MLRLIASCYTVLLQWAESVDYNCCSVDVDLTSESFPADFEDRRVIYWHGVDNENRKICKYVKCLSHCCILQIIISVMSVCLVCLSVWYHSSDKQFSVNSMKLCRLSLLDLRWLPAVCIEVKLVSLHLIVTLSELFMIDNCGHALNMSQMITSPS